MAEGEQREIDDPEEIEFVLFRGDEAEDIRAAQSDAAELGVFFMTGLFALLSEDWGGPVRVRKGELIGDVLGPGDFEPGPGETPTTLPTSARRRWSTRARPGRSPRSGGSRTPARSAPVRPARWSTTAGAR